MSTTPIPTNSLREAKRLFGKLRHRRFTLPVLTHVLLTSGPGGVFLAVTDLDHWLEIRVSDEGFEPQRFLIPPDAMDAACRADRGSLARFTPAGGKRSTVIRLATSQGGIEAGSVHPTLDPGEFPERPVIAGEETTLPPATLANLAVVSGCASKDPTRLILNGVFFTPGDGGLLVATDGRRLACCPAVVPPHEFVLPGLAVAVLEQTAFSSDLVTVTWLEPKDPECQRIAFRCGRHLLVARTIVGNYPNFRQVIPTDSKQIAVIPHDRRPGVIAWLRGVASANSSSTNTDESVRLDWESGSRADSGRLTLTHRDRDGHSAAITVPVEIHGNPPVIAFNAAYLADGLKIGSTLCLSDELSPGICRHPAGRFCVIMPMRVTGDTGTTREVDEAPPPQHEQAAA
jgi:DNA polymerase III subunit beta